MKSKHILFTILTMLLFGITTIATADEDPDYIKNPNYALRLDNWPGLYISKYITPEKTGALSGIITFDKARTPHLDTKFPPNLAQPTPEEAATMKKNWAEISAMPSLTWERTSESGAKDSVQVKPGEAGYIFGLQQILQKKYGYFVVGRNIVKVPGYEPADDSKLN